MDRRRMMMTSGTPEPEVERDWLKFDILTAGTVLWKCATDKERTISYRKNGGKWTNITSSTSGVSISVAVGDIVEFKGNNADYGGEISSSGQGSYFDGTATYNASGNISTMLGDSETLPADLALAHLFHSAKVVSAEDLILPYMTLTSSCYSDMFNGCTNLTTAPELPATTLANYCYYNMFHDCTSLITAPVLPAATLADYCYYQMFYGCFRLNSITCFATTKSASYCTYSWLSGVSASGTFIKAVYAKWATGTSGIPSRWTVTGNYLTFVATQSGTFSFTGNIIKYSLDNGETWARLSSGTNSPTVSAGSKIMWKTILTPTQESGIGTFSSTGKFNVEGNVMSLLYENFDHQTSLSGKDYAFQYLFKDCSRLISAEKLSLPATTLAERCYYAMFQNCTNLTTAPKLPATTLASYCYAFMFYRNKNLTTTPKLPATTLADYCYYQMFYGCTNLTTAPELPATTLATSCYYSMFYNCTSLTTAPELRATAMENNCYRGMFYGCTNLTTAPELPATTLKQYCYCKMFYGCTSLTTAPELPATTLKQYCYQSMFGSCSNLSNITCLAIDISATNCVDVWLSGVSASGTFTKAASMTSWTTGTSGIPSGWTVQDYIE